MCDEVAAVIARPARIDDFLGARREVTLGVSGGSDGDARVIDKGP
jgi:hypothetical protein